MRRFSKVFLMILLLAIVFRIFIIFYAFQFQENTDILRYQDWIRISYLYGFSDTYKTTHIHFGTLPNNQPPGFLYILGATNQLEIYTTRILLQVTKMPIAKNSLLPNVFLRIPSLLADIILGACIYLFIKKRRPENNALIGASLFLFTPPVWYNSAFWGQMDSLNNVLFFISVYFLYEHKFFRSILFCFFSLFVKVSLLPAIPVYFFILYFEKNEKQQQLIPTIFICILIIFILTIPVSHANFFWLFDFFRKNSFGELKHITNFAFNLWWLFINPAVVVGKPTNLLSFSDVSLSHMTADSLRLGGVPLHAWAVGLFVTIFIPLMLTLYPHGKKLLLQNGVLALALVMLVCFVIAPMMHERYMYPTFPLLAAYVGLQRKFLIVFLLLSLFNSINLYIVWHPMLLFLLPYQVIANRTFQWLISLGVVATSMYFTIASLKLFLNYEKNRK